jgi:hypothetical protein
MSLYRIAGAVHDFSPAGVEFPFPLFAYLNSRVKPLYAYIPKDRFLTRNYTTNSVRQMKAQAMRFNNIVEMWQAAFEKLGYKATTSQLAKVVQYELRSVTKSLDLVMARTTSLEKRLPTKKEIIDFNIPYNNRMGCKIWIWNPNGKILTEEELHGY